MDDRSWRMAIRACVELAWGTSRGEPHALALCHADGGRAW